ncbi:ROK family protein (plasmid) [Mesorhizobium loti]|uniref:ROK family protein n=1 Tax=Mesorhizobium jarvisii TaxID=1777867 RepID=A0A6M7TUC4_9HYPH|nr:MULTISPECIES: ROK family protein [Mesorhizobium]OBQ69612.1 sugar kinase [Mesorhizobium loti]QKC67493.1 ROK family protein [Mesorhizobium jarvisii]QKD13407.1 ROK family protein [Mesorhizobium loti]RJT29517.1 ROK family protein [Mesorhizobium jarvisii]
MTDNTTDDTIAVVEIGGTSVKVGFADHGIPVDFARTYPTAQLRQGAPVVGLAHVVAAASRDSGLKPASVVATVPGFIDKDFDTVLHTANFPELEGIRLGTELASKLGVPVRLERDVVLQLLGESVAGAVAQQSEVLAVYLGTGIGAAYLGKDGIFRGGGWALEIGHMPVYRPDDGRRPKRAETYASGATLVELASDYEVPVADLFAAVGQPPSLGEWLDEIVWQQAVTIATAAALFSPQTILIGGGIVDMKSYPRQTLKQRIADSLPHSLVVQPLDIRWAALGWQAAIHGAVLLAAV